MVHDWLVAQRGGEHVLLQLARLFPEAPIYTLVHAKGSADPEIEAHPIRTSFIQSLPGVPHTFRPYLPLFAAAIETFDLKAFDLILSTSHCVAKGVRLRTGQVHLAYIHTPMRYLWDQLAEYLPQIPGRHLLEPPVRLLTAPLRHWDVTSSRRPTRLIANSEFVAGRIKRVWGRNADVVYPPVDVDYFARARRVARRGFLVVSALVAYKRVDLAVALATRSLLDLTVVGDGPELPRLRAMAGPTVRFVGSLGPAELRQAYAGARALLFCGVEDFGIVPVEAMATGCPVIALQEGGALETVKAFGKTPTGVFFREPSLAAIDDAVRRFEVLEAEGAFARDVLLAHARRFSSDRFVAGFTAILDQYARGSAPTPEKPSQPAG
ncbi:MAG: glycosyltransferase [Deltaproteobacteria bacterium]|nr:glycosyltransferase [Deltaproteobacteria bacterium]